MIGWERWEVQDVGEASTERSHVGHAAWGETTKAFQFSNCCLKMVKSAELPGRLRQRQSMARMIGLDLAKWDYNKMPYEIQTSLAAQYVPAFHISPFPLPGIERLEQSGIRFPGPARADIHVPDDAFPTAASEAKGFKSLPDFLNLSCWMGVSEDFRNLVEEFEPGVHQFSDEVVVTYKNGRRSEKKYFCFNARNYLEDTIIIEKSTGYRAKSGRYDPGVKENSLVLDANIIGGRHLWRAKDHYLFIYVSDELGKAIMKNKLKKLDFKHQNIGSRGG